jgi:DNA-binding transcriptional LysR family regulator
VPEALNLKRLEHLVLLAEEQNFARAALRSCLSQSAFSRSIAALERSLRITLIDRGSRHLRFTPAGARVVARARPLLSSTRDLRAELDLLARGDLGDVAAGAGPFTAVALFPPALARLRAAHPRVSVRLHVESAQGLLRRLREETIDFFLSDTREIAASSGIAVRQLGTLVGSLFCRDGHPLLARPALRLEDLSNACVASVHMPQVVRQSLSHLVRAHAGRELPVVFECESSIVMRELVLRSDVLLLACRESVAWELNAGLLRELTVRELQALGAATPLRTEIGIVRAPSRTITPASELLLHQVLDVASRVLAKPATAILASDVDANVGVPV